MNKLQYLELKKMFYEQPEWIRKMQVRNLGFFARLHYNFFIKIMSFRMDLTLRKLRILQRNFEIQEKAFVLVSCKILFTDKFNESLKNSVQQSEKFLESIQKEIK